MTSALSQVTKRLGGLPPDPDGMNDDRAKRIDDALRGYTGVIDENTVADFLCDFKHWLDRHPEFDIDVEAERAAKNYESETWNQDANN